MMFQKMIAGFRLFFWLCASAMAHAQTESPVIVGKNDWLFVRYGMMHESFQSEVLASIELIKKTNRMLQKANVRLVVLTTPLKMEIYSEYLPDGFEVSRYMKGFNDATLARLSEGGVAVIDLKKTMRQAALENPETPLFYRLDTHWTHSGTYIAAQTVLQGLLTEPGLKKVYEAIPAVPYTLTWDKKMYVQSRIRDIVSFLPTGTPAYAPERTKKFSVVRSRDAVSENGKEATQGGELVLTGSSMSGDWLGFPDALRFALQRNVSNFSINGDLGPWVGLRAYLQNNAFQIKKPSLILWEIPGQTFELGPNYQLRLERYKIHPQLWLLQIAALTEPVCDPVSVKIQVRAGAGSPTGQESANSMRSAFEIQFDKPLDSSMYLRAKAVTNGTQQMTVEAWSKQQLKHRMNVDAGTDGTDHALRIPIGVGLKDISQLKVNGISAISDVQMCKYSENWLAR